MKSNITKLLVTASVYLSPLMAFAQVPDLVSDSDRIPNSRTRFTLTELLETGNTLVNIFVSVVVTLSVVFIIWGGFTFITAAGDSEKLTAARNRILYGVIGIAIIILAGGIFALVSTIL